VSMKTLLSHGGLHQGFGAVSDPNGQKLTKDVTRYGRETTELTRAWLEKISADPRTPFFAWIHYYEPHSPYRTTDFSKQRLADYAGRFSEGISSIDFALGKWLFFAADRAAIWTFYNGQMLDADLLLGELLDLLESKDLLANTIVVVTSDHGQALGEHGHPGHGPALWQSVLHVPLLIWDSRERKGRRVDERVGLIDLTPTLLELAGLRVPENVQGRSLVPALRGDALGERMYISEIRAPFKGKQGYHNPPPYTLAAFEGRFKLMASKDGGVLYDLEADPGELAPLRRGDAPERYDRLSKLVRDYDATTRADATPEELPREVIEGLRALGYAQ